MGVCGQRHAPAGKIRYQLYMRLGRKQDPSGRVQKISPPQGFDPRTVQSVATELSCPTVCIYIYIYNFKTSISTTYYFDFTITHPRKLINLEPPKSLLPIFFYNFTL